MLKKFIQYTTLIAMLLATSILPLFAAMEYQVEHQPQVIEQLLQFEQKGTLKQMANGYLYLDVTNDFITFGLPMIEAEGVLVPTIYYSSENGIGAHISIMYQHEQHQHGITEINEIGEEFTFTFLELRTMSMNRNNKTQKVWLIAVAAPELELLREKYGLSAKLNGEDDFHVTICLEISEEEDEEL